MGYCIQLLLIQKLADSVLFICPLHLHTHTHTYTYTHGGAIAVTTGVFSDPSLSPIVTGVQCNGSETDLLSCYHSNFIESSNCDISTDAGVVCQGTYIDY